MFGMAFFAIQTNTVQSWLAKRIAGYLSKELGTTVTIGSVEVDIWATLIINELYIADQKQDTLAYIHSISLSNYSFEKNSGEIIVHSAVLDKPYFNLVRHEGDTFLNHKFILDYVGVSEDSTSQTLVFLHNIEINDGRFHYTNENRTIREEFGIDWNYIEANELNLALRNFSMIGDSVHADQLKLSAKEKTGFHIKDMTTELFIVPGGTRMTRAHIVSNESVIDGDLFFGYTSIDDFDDVENKLKMNHQFEMAQIQMEDLAYFSSYLKGYNKVVTLSGKMKGTVSNLKGRDINITLDENTHFRGNFDFEGLPEIDQTFISMDIKSLTTNKTELDRIQLPPYDSLHYVKTPTNFAQLGQITYKGNFTGFINDFVSFGTIQTAIGNVSTDISLKEIPEIDDYNYTGALGLSNFDLGKFYSTESLGPVTCDLTVEGQGLELKKVNATFKGNIAGLYINGYNYTNINVDGEFKQRSFAGDFTINDPNVNMDFTGNLDFAKPDPVLHFDAQIAHLNLKAVHILEDYDYSSVSGSVSVKSEGLDFDKFQGEIILDDITYCAMDRDYQLNHLALTSIRGDSPLIILDSDIAYAEIKGIFEVKEIGDNLLEIASKIIPSFKPPAHKHKSENFVMDVKIFDFAQVSEVFIPELYIAKNTMIKLVIDEPGSYFETLVVSDTISYMGNTIAGLTFDVKRPDESFYITATSDRVMTSAGVNFSSLALDARTERDTVYTAFAWGDENYEHQGDINGKLTVRDYNQYDFVFNESSVRVKSETWNFEQGSEISADSSEIFISDFAIFSNNQYLRADGCISQRSSDLLEIDIQNFDISSVNPFIGGSTKFYGIMNGQASIRDVYNDFIFSNDVVLDGFKLNEYEIGNLNLRSGWDQGLRQLRIDGKIDKNLESGNPITRYTPLSFAGYYRPHDEKSQLDITATIKDLDLSFINAFMSPGIMDIAGLASGTMLVTGNAEAPQLQADAQLKDASIFLYYLNTRYFIFDEIGVYPDMFTFDHIPIKDQEGNSGFLTGQMLHNNFEKWNFDLVIDMEEPMLALNTNEELNPLYYGKAYTTGTVNIYGYDDKLEFDCTLKTERGTSLAMPMGSTSEQTFENFVQFVNSGDTIAEAPLNLSGIKLNMNIEITPDAEFKIIFDESVGDVMKGSGKGHVNLEINNLSTFNMYGLVELTRGDYLFTLKNLINKEFTISPGGTISWFGDPFSAELDIKAIYKVTASLYDLIQDVSYKSGQRVPVNLELNLRGKMLNPGIDFDIELPTVDQVTKTRIESIMSTEQERNRQAFALLVLRRFVSPPNVASEHSSTNPFAANGTELLSSQISNWLSQISDDFNLGFNYSPGDDISNEEIALALSTQLFNERLALSSNVGVSRNTGSTTSNTNTTNLIGDIRIEYKITAEGKIRLVVYNESNDFRMANTQQSPYTQGVGVIYREDFDNFNEFVTEFKKMLKGKEKKES